MFSNYVNFKTEFSWMPRIRVTIFVVARKPSLLYLDDTGYRFADKQPNYIELRNIEAPVKRMTHQDDVDRMGDGRYQAIEHDPTIDENAVVQSFKWHLNGNQR